MYKKFAVFDIDGTLVRWQLYHAIVGKLAKQDLLGESTHAQLNQARMVWKRREDPEAFKAYEHTLIGIYESSVSTLNPKDFDNLVQEVIGEYKDQVYVYTRNLIIDLKKQGYLLLAISGSHSELVEQIAKYYGFDDWLGTEYERVDGRFSGKSQVASHDKRSGLKKLVEKHSLDYKHSLAIGDSASDIPMLEMVEQPIAFNPEMALLIVAQKHGWNIVVERKNVVYKLVVDDGKYILV